MKISLFSESLFTLSLEDAIRVTRKAGYLAIELACKTPHLNLEIARYDSRRIAEMIRHEGLKVSALSLYNRFTDPACVKEQIEAAETFIRLAPLFQTKTVKLTPGPPGSADATANHWDCLASAIKRLVPVADEVGVQLAFETHMRQLTDTLASAQHLLEIAPSDTVGLTVDFSNLAFAGEPLCEAIAALKDRMYHTHVKNGYIDDAGGWHFQPLDEGLTDYPSVFGILRKSGYEGYLSVECLGPDAQQRPEQTARRDLAILKRLLEEPPCKTPNS
jgi:L-ribulose-5-phosphate 3-epimerase